MKLGILNEFNDEHLDYVTACKELGIDYEVIDVIDSKWIQYVKNGNYDGILVRPSYKHDVATRMYVEKLYIINKILNIPIYPLYSECVLYENKRMMSYWLEANNIPRPWTKVFYSRKEAIHFLNHYTKYPIIFKPNKGSAAMGIKKVNKRQGKRLVNNVFTKLMFFNMGHMKWYPTKYKVCMPLMDDKQYNNILFQEVIDIKYEWRGIRIGDSYFAHKKLEGDNGMHSGSGLADYSNPPKEVLEFIRKVCDKGEFRSMDVDFFEDMNGKFYVNELQTVFGSKINSYQMLVDGREGRYRYENDKWVFEEGEFNKNNSCNLRVIDFIKLLEA